MKNISYYLIFSFLLFTTVAVKAHTNSIQQIPNITSQEVPHFPISVFEDSLAVEDLFVSKEWFFIDEFTLLRKMNIEKRKITKYYPNTLLNETILYLSTLVSAWTQLSYSSFAESFSPTFSNF